MEKSWKLIEIPAEKLEALRYTGFPDILLRILVSRGITDVTSIERFFEARTRFLFSPFMIDGIWVAVDRLLKAVETEESMRVYGDRDVDGITSTVLLTESLRTLSKHVDYTVPVIEDGYGLNPDYIDAAASDGVSLIITVDCGISNIAEVEYARQKGIDVIITDHHEPPSELPAAVAIVNPKLVDCCCPQKDIAGVGVAFKMAMALEMARSPRLSRPLIVFDMTSSDLEIIRFTPREGFSQVKVVDKNLLASSEFVFYNRAEQMAIGEILPEVVIDKELKPVYLEKLLAKCVPDKRGGGKADYAQAFNLDEVKGARCLLFMYLKCIEAKMPAIQRLWQRCLDILTIGTVADMVPMRGENRAYAQMGMRFIAKTRRIGLNSLFTMLGWKNRQVTERDISFSISPILNSSGRLKTAELAIDLLSTNWAPKAEELAKQLYELNTERKRLGEICYQETKQFLIEQNDLENDRILMVAAPIKNQGVTGIVATRLMLDYCRPVIVLLEDHEKFLGSARSFKKINIIEALNSCSDLLEKYGGHVGAAGLTLPFANVDAFRKRLRDYARENISLEDLQPEWLIDAEIDLEMITEQFLEDIQKFAPFGIENPAPLFLASAASFQEIRKVGEGKNHLRFKFRRNNGRNLFGIGFNLGDIMVPDLIRDGSCDLVFHVEPNEYNGVRSVQLMVVDCRIKVFK